MVYYLEHWQEDEIVELFSHNPECFFRDKRQRSVQGWEAIKPGVQLWPITIPPMVLKKLQASFFHILMPNCRYNRFFPQMGKLLREDGMDSSLELCLGRLKPKPWLAAGIWENEYIKEKGIWKFQKLFGMIFLRSIDEGWVKTPFLGHPRTTVASGFTANFQHYPSGYIYYHIITKILWRVSR